MDISSMGRIPPHNVQAEQSVLGAMLLDTDAILTAIELLKSYDFYRDDHKEIFEVILELFDKTEPVDLITVSDLLKQKGKLGDIGGLEYLTNIANVVPTTSNVKYYAKIVEEKSILRRLIKT